MPARVPRDVVLVDGVGIHFAASITGAVNLLVTVTCRNAADLYMYVTGVVGRLGGGHLAPPRFRSP